MTAAMRIDAPLQCPHCDQWMENTAGGNHATCPDITCGKLWPRLTPAQETEIEEARILASGLIPIIRGRVSRYEVDGREFRAMRRCRSFHRAKEFAKERPDIRIVVYRPELTNPFLVLSAINVLREQPAKQPEPEPQPLFA